MSAKRLLFTAAIWLPSLVVAQGDNATASCDTPPFAMPVGNCELESGLRSWGVLFQIGTDPQRVCLVPSTVVNITLVNQQEPLCTISNTSLGNQCESIRGGFFNQNESTTWRPADLTNSNITTEEPIWEHFNPDGMFDKIGWDDIRIRGSQDFTLYSAGIALNDRGWQSNAGMIGLGIDSVFLEDTIRQNRSASRSWGLDAGSRSATNGRPGELVVGGYNDGRVDSDFFSFPISIMEGDRPCPLRVKISGLTLISPNGTVETNLKESSVLQTACIEPYDNLFRWTADMIRAWKTATGFDESLVDPYTTTGKELAFVEPGLPYAEERTQDWAVRIKLENGYETTITYDEMHRPLQGWNGDGQLETVENITNVAIFNKPVEAGEIPTLGKIFLSRSYLRVDYETGTFGLARANTNPSPPSDLRAIQPARCNATSAPDAGGGGGDKPPVGAIVGGVVGGVAFVILIVALIIYLGKRRRAKAAKGQPEMRGPSRSGTGDPEPLGSWGFVAPLPEREREFSNATTHTQATNGMSVSPRGSTTVGGDGGPVGRERSPMTPGDIQSLKELP